jgi:hypothetical protein
MWISAYIFDVADIHMHVVAAKGTFLLAAGVPIYYPSVGPDTSVTTLV